MTARFTDHMLGPDTHTNRPAASTVPYGALYECNTHALIYKNSAGTWITWAAVLPAGGTTGQSLTKTSGTDYDVAWSTVSGSGGSTKTPLEPTTPLDTFPGSALDAAWSVQGAYVSGDYAVGDSWLAVTNPRINNNYFYRTPPAGWTVMTAKMTAFAPTSGTAFGLMAVDNTGAGVGGSATFNGAPDGLLLGTLVGGNYTAGNQSYAGILSSLVKQGLVHWLRIRKSGTSYFLSASLNGVNWSPETAALTNAATITRIGFGAWFNTAAPTSFGLDWFHAA